MQTITVSTRRSPRRFVPGRRISLTSDGVHASGILIFLTVALLAVLVGGAAGTAVYFSRSHEFDSDRRTHHEVTATATHDSAAVRQLYGRSFVTPLAWHYRGLVLTADVQTMHSLKVGDEELVGIDAGGNFTSTIPFTRDAVSDATAVAFSWWLAVVSVGAAMLAARRDSARSARPLELHHKPDNRALNEDLTKSAA